MFNVFFKSDGYGKKDFQDFIFYKEDSFAEERGKRLFVCVLRLTDRSWSCRLSGA